MHSKQLRHQKIRGPHGHGPGSGYPPWGDEGGPPWAEGREGGRRRGGGRGPAKHGRHGRGGRRRGRGRVSRGQIRHAVLTLLVDEAMHGYQLMQEMEERSGGGWQPSPGSIYPTLQLLADEGLVVSEPEGGKNIFSLTESGREAAEALEGPPVWERFEDDGAAGYMTLRRSVSQIGAAAKQVAAAGSERQVEAANHILTDARKALYQLLADDE